MKVWILTSEYNDYDQHGEYFVAVFSAKPTAKQLEEKGVTAFEVPHVLNGGGRVGNEYSWWHLNEENAA